MIGRSLKTLRAALEREQGFTMITVMGTMLVVMLASAAAIGAATSDLGGGARDKASKQALSAAEAGVNDYSYHLTLNNNYWSLCTDVPEPAIVNQRDDGGSSLRWRNLPGTNAQYAIELLAANGKPACSKTDASGTMIESTTGTFRIRASGRVPTGKNSAGATTYATRKLISTYRRKGFLDFLYFTNYETSDPAWYKLETGGRETRNNSSDTTGKTRLLDWAASTSGCKTYYRNGRASRSWTGQIHNSSNNWVSKSAGCNEIQFASNDAVKGPLHTNDSLLVCGTPTFGEVSSDLIEVEAQTSSVGGAWRSNCGGSDPDFVGTLRPGATHLEPPTSNSSLKTTVAPAYSYTGATEIELTGATMTVKNGGTTSIGVALPPNGVIYVADGNCGGQYDPLNPSTPASAPGCGNAFVKGTSSRDLTIAAESDVVIRGSVTKTNDAVLGLIANQFVRVHHPVKNVSTTVGSNGSVSADCDNDPAGAFYFTNVTIDAAILALNHSFTVDRYYCGNPTGTLTVNGVIAQQFRGPVGTGSGGNISTGYVKNYLYDRRLSLRQPPYFLDPVQASWRVARQTEQAAR